MARPTIIWDDAELTATLDGLTSALSRSQVTRLLGRIANLVKFNILRRTARGVDREEKPFVPYSLKYRLFRQEKGRPTEKVNLFFTGQMSAAMQTKTSVAAMEASILFASRTEALKAASHTFGSVSLPKRDFFGVSAKDLEAVNEELERFIDGALS